MKNAIVIGGLTVVALGLIAFAVFRYLESTQRQQLASSNQNPLTQTLTPSMQVTEDNLERADKGQGQQQDTTKPPEASQLPSIKVEYDGNSSFFSDNPSDPTNQMQSNPNAAMNDSGPVEMMQTEFNQTEWDNLVKQARQAIAAKDFELFNKTINDLIAMQNR